MSQNLISLSVSAEQLAAISAAIDTLETQLAGLIELSVDDRRKLVKMGDKSEAFCRQTLIVLDQNRQMIPPSLDLARAEDDLRTLDRKRAARPREVTVRSVVAGPCAGVAGNRSDCSGRSAASPGFRATKRQGQVH